MVINLEQIQREDGQSHMTFHSGVGIINVGQAAIQCHGERTDYYTK